MPSCREGGPAAGLEAASCASPMLLSDIEPNRDVGLATHHYFPVGDVAALAERPRCPASDYAIDGDAILSTFDWDHISERTLAISREGGASAACISSPIRTDALAAASSELVAVSSMSTRLPTTSMKQERTQG